MANVIDIIVRSKDETKSGTDSAKSNMKGLKGAIGDVGKAAAGFLSANVIQGGFQAFTGFLSDSTDAALDARKAQTQLAAVIKSTGGAAGMSVKDIEDMATGMAKLTNYDDDAVVASSNVLLTFTQIGSKVFPRAQQAILDVSTALGQDLQSSTIQVGKALNDPIKGITALQRVGVTFDAAQKKQIATMQKHHDTAGAQAVILKELEKEFGGSAAAAVKADGGITQAKNAMGELQETIGGKLIPIQAKWQRVQLAVVSAIADKALPAFDAVSKWISTKGQPLFERFVAWAQSRFVPIFENVGAIVTRDLLPPLMALGKFIIGTVVPALAKLVDMVLRNQDVLAAIGVAILTMLVPAFVAWAISAGAAAVATLLAAAPFILLGVVIAAFAYLVIHNWDTIKRVTLAVFHAVKDAIAAAFNWVKANWPLLLAILTGPIGLAVLAIVRNWDKIKAGFSAAFNAIKRIAGDVINAVVSFVANIPRRLGKVADSIYHKVADAFTNIRDWAHKMVNDLVNFILGIPGRVAGVAKKIIDKITPDVGKGVPFVPGIAHGGITGAASGGPKGGMKLVGEHGPELVSLPAGSRVHGNSMTRGMLAGGSGPVQVVLSINPTGASGLERLFMDWLREAIRHTHGGDVQAALGR